MNLLLQVRPWQYQYQSVDEVRYKAAERELQLRVQRETDAVTAQATEERLREEALPKSHAAEVEQAVEDDTKKARGRMGLFRHAFSLKEAKKAAKKA